LKNALSWKALALLQSAGPYKAAGLRRELKANLPVPEEIITNQTRSEVSP
jgi:hypothetical protein